MVHPTAIISEKAKIGNDVVIGPYCVIGDDVTIGDRCELKSHDVIAGIESNGMGVD